MNINKKFTKTEELTNAISHLTGAVLATAGLVVMIIFSSLHGNGLHVATTTVFGATMVILYFSSTMTHILPMGRAKDRFFNMDRIAIYLLIAGTYTPLSLITLHGPVGWVIFGLEWGLALVGILMILFKPGDYDTGVNPFFVVSYAVMGWLLLIAIVPIIRILPTAGWLLLLAGGFSYTLGIFFFSFSRFPFHHLVWHLLVMAGSACHFFMVFYYIIPR